MHSVTNLNLAQFDERVAFVFDGAAWPYRWLDEARSTVARQFGQHLVHGRLLAIWLRNSPLEHIWTVEETGLRLVYQRDGPATATQPPIADTALVLHSSGTSGKATRAVDIMNHLSATLSDYKLPREIHFLENLPLNSNGKVSRQALRRQFQPADEH